MLHAGELFPPPSSEGGGLKEAGMDISPCTLPRQPNCEFSESDMDWESEPTLISNQAVNPYTATASSNSYCSQTSHLTPNRQLLSPSPLFSVLTRPSSAEPQTSFNLPNSENNPLTLQSCNTPSTSSLQRARNSTIQSRSDNHGLPHLPSPTAPFLPSSSASQFAASIQLPQLDLPPMERTSPLQSTSALGSCPKLPSIVHTSQQTSHTLNQHHNIKSFLPVNKPVDHTNKSTNNTSASTNTTIPNFPANFSHFLASQGTKSNSVSQNKQPMMGKQNTTVDSAPAANPINSVIQRPRAQTPSTEFFSKTFDLTSSNFRVTTLQNPSTDMVAKKRKSAEEIPGEKRAKLDKKGRVSKKELKPESVSSPSKLTFLCMFF